MTDSVKKPVVLVILDGWGFSEQTTGNPVKQAKLSNLDAIAAQYPMVLLQASGPAVGLTWGEAGSSEVGHLAIGAGRIVNQYNPRINEAIKNGTFFVNQVLVGAFEHAKQSNGRVHLVGLLTSGTVHAAFNHLIALIQMAAENNPSQTFVHLFLDGRDSGLREGVELIKKLEQETQKNNHGKIAAVIGRDWAMDRNNNWERTQKTYQLIAKAEGEKTGNLIESITDYYQKDVNDSQMPALVSSASGFNGMADGDAVIFFNFREDSMRQIFRSFTEENFTNFQRAILKNVYLCSMTKYLEEQTAPVAFPPPEVKNCLAEVLAAAGKMQLHIAETDKYAHVTYFFNALNNQPFAGETDVFIDSVKNIEQNPAMASVEIGEKVAAALEPGRYDFILANFANADLLAHTGNFEAVVRGMEAVDAALGRVLNKALEKDAVLIVTADHGNAESLIYKTGGEAETKHGTNPVFFYLVDNVYRRQKSFEQIAAEKAEVNGILPDIAPTILELMGLPQPPEMTGQSLLPLLLEQ